MKKRILLIFMIIVFLVNPILLGCNYIIGAPTGEPSLKNLPTGWIVETLYEKEYTPFCLCVNNEGEVLFLDQGRYEVLKFNAKGNITTHVLMGTVFFDYIAYQPVSDRILCIDTDEMGLHAYNNITERFDLINEFSPNQIDVLEIDPTNDFFYGASQANGSSIFLYNSSGHFNKTIVEKTQGIWQMALNESKNILYYSECFTGNIIKFNLTNNESTIIGTGRGVPGFGEGVGLDMDENGTLYCLDTGPNHGVYKYNGSAFVFAMNDDYGIGQMVWSSKHRAFFTTGTAGGCLVKYDPSEINPEKLTPTVNTGAIIETQDDLVLVGIDEQIFQVGVTGLTNFSEILPARCNELVVDSDDNIYAALSNDTLSIVRVHRNGSFTPWFQKSLPHVLNSLFYDSINDEMVMITKDEGANQTKIWRIPIDNPLNHEVILTFTGTLMFGTIDKSGNIYVYDHDADFIYRIPAGTNQTNTIFSGVSELILILSMTYCSVEHGLIVGRNDYMTMYPLSGGASYTFAGSDTGIDFGSLFETENQELIGTHSSHIYRLKYVGAPGGFNPIGIIVLVLSIILLGIAIVIQRTRNRKQKIVKIE